MIPILFEGYETAFTTNGIGRLADCISCTVTEERNGIYECLFTYPVTGEMFSEIQEGRIIGVIHDDAKDIQPFDIYAHSAPLDGVVTFYAHHISYRLGSVILKPMQAGSCVDALNAIPSNTYNCCPFTFWTDKAVSGQWKNNVPSAVKAILGGQEGSILDVYGKGEYYWDKWSVRLYANRGNDNGVSIRYGVNLTDLKQEYDESGSYNAVAPYWISSEDGTVVTLTNGIVAVSGGTRLVPWTIQSDEEITDSAYNIIHFEISNPITPVPMDLSEAFDEQPTEAQLETEALRRLNNSEAWLPSENIAVKFVNLADTEEYKNVAALQRVSLCDKVSVYCGPLGVSAVKMQVIRVIYNVLTERYDEIELGKAKVSFSQAITAKVEEITKDLPTASMMQQAINSATDQITGAKGGHVRFIYDANGEMQEILIMDTDDINTAVKVWRWNSGGFGFSSNGYAGPYVTAITQDGQIVADFITVGTMLANIIKGGTLTLGGSNNVNGTLIVKDANNNIIGTWNNDGISLYKGSIAGSSITLGGANNANGALNIKDASGNVIGTWTKDGISISKGSININNGVFGLTNAGALTASNASLTGSIVTTGTDRYGNALTTKIKSGYVSLYGTYEPYPLLSITGHEDHGVSPRGANLFSYGRIYIESQIYTGSNISPGQIIFCTDYGTDGFIELQSANFRINNYFRDVIEYHTNYSGSESFDISCAVQMSSSLTVSGTKSRVVSTDQYADRLLYCYETSSPMFGDIGEGIINDDGLCYITIDSVFAQTISTSHYQVFLQKYGDGDCWVKERKCGYFIVQGTPGLAFGWELKAKQADFDQKRLDRNDEPFSVPNQTFGMEAANYIDELKKGRVVA